MLEPADAAHGKAVASACVSVEINATKLNGAFRLEGPRLVFSYYKKLYLMRFAASKAVRAPHKLHDIARMALRWPSVGQKWKASRSEEGSQQEAKRL